MWLDYDRVAADGSMREMRRVSYKAMWLVSIVVATGCTTKEDAAPTQAPAPLETDSNSPSASVEVSADPEPAFASPIEATAGRPPHPGIPTPLEEPEPSQDMLVSSSFRWLAGHWMWTGNQYEWQPGLWIYDVPGYELVPPQWDWDGEYWLYRDAGWRAVGETRISARPTAAPGGTANTVPDPGLSAPNVDLFVAPSSHAVYVWTGTWVAPPIAYPGGGTSGDASRYRVRIKSESPVPEPSQQPSAPPSGDLIVVGSEQPSTTNDAEQDEEVELIPGVLHGGKRGEEERRLMEEQKEREAREEEDGVDSVYVPYYYGPDYYYRRHPNRPRPPARPRPLPAPAPTRPSPKNGQ